MDCHPEILRARQGSVRRTLGAFLAFGALAIAALIGLRNWVGPGLPECKPENLLAARERWESAGVRDYDLAITISGRQSGEITVSVRDGRPTAMTRNGVQPKQERSWEPWTVPGMFETIDIDFENAKNPKEKFGNDAAGVNIRCKFDEQYGYPKQYLHQVLGRQMDLEWEVKEFRPKLK